MEIELSGGLVAMALFTTGVMVGAAFYALWLDVRQWDRDERRIKRELLERERVPK